MNVSDIILKVSLLPPQITYDGQAPSWHRAQILIPDGEIGIAFQFRFARISEMNAGIDNVTLTPGACEVSGKLPQWPVTGVLSWYHINLSFEDWVPVDEVYRHPIFRSVTVTWQRFNSSLPGQNGRHFTDVIFRCLFVNENLCISIKNSLKFVPRGPINNISALVQIMAWCRTGDKPLSEPMIA